MSNHGLRRMFSLLLAVMMVCTLLPAAAFAAEGAEPPAAAEQLSGSPGVEEPQKPAEASKALPESAVKTADTNAPAEPTEDEIAGALDNPAVILHCTTENLDSSQVQFGYVKDATYDVTEPRLENGSYTCTVTIYAAGYVSRLNKVIPHLTHTLNDAESKTVKLTYDSAGKRWSASPKSVTFNVSCPARKPTKPSGIELYDEFNVYVVCDTDSTAHPAQKITPQPGSFNVGEVEGNEADGYTCTVTVTADVYVRIFRDRNPGAWSHALVPTEESTKTFILTRVGNEWKLPDDLNITFHVKCVPYCFVYYKDGVAEEAFENQVTRVAMGDPTPAFEGIPTREGYDFAGWDPEVAETVTKDYTYYTAKWTKQSPKKPTNAEAEGLIPRNAIKVSCLHSAHKPFSTLDLKDGKYEILGVTLENGDYYCTIKLDPLSYASNSSIVYHKLDPENQNPTIQLKYDTATEAWTVMTSTPVNITVICNYTVTYTDGVDGAAFADQVYSDLKFGEATPEFNGEPTRQGYIFDGWSPAVDPIVYESRTYTARWWLNTPAPPSVDDINALLNDKVRIECTGIHTANTKGLIPGTYTTGSVVHDDDSGFICTVTITNPDAYVSDYSNATGETHTLSSVTPQDAAITLKYVDGKWTLPGDGITITTSCSAFPEAPTTKVVEDTFAFHIRINLKCSTIKAFYACYLNEGNYRIGSVTKEGSDYYCTLEFDLPSYVAANSSTFLCSSGPHRLVPENQKNTIKLKYAKDLYTKWLIDGDEEIDVTVTCAYTVTYTDGVDGEEIFPDETADVIYGKATPAFTGGTPKRTGYVFSGWNPAVAPTVTGDVTYTAQWEADVNGNGIADKDEETYTVTYTDGANGKAFDDQTYGRLLSGTATPEFNGTPKRAGYTFDGWSPKVSKTVTGNVTYTATWKSTGKDKVPKTGDGGLALILGGMLLFSLSGMAVCALDRRKKQGR